MPGIVKLFYGLIEFESNSYSDRTKRRRFILRWQKKHGEAFDSMELIIIPTDTVKYEEKTARRAFVGWERSKLKRIERYKAKKVKEGNMPNKRMPQSTKLNPKLVLQIREQKKAGQSNKSLAENFSVSIRTIMGILNGETWNHVI